MIRGAGPSSWNPAGVDPVLEIQRLQDAYFARFPDYDTRHHRAGIVDIQTGRWSPTTSRR